MLGQFTRETKHQFGMALSMDLSVVFHALNKIHQLLCIIHYLARIIQYREIYSQQECRCVLKREEGLPTLYGTL